MRPAESQNILQPPHRARKVFCFSLAGHLLLVVLPLLLGVLADWLHPQDREDLTVNLVDEPSVGPEVAPQTTRLPPSPTPEPEVNPPPVPPKPAPQEPEIADLPKPAPPEPEVADLPVPAPPKPKPKKAPPEPAFDLPKVVKPKPATPPPQDRKLTDSRKTGVRTGERKDPRIPISGKETSQRYGEKASDSPDGGKRNDARYAAMLGAFLKARWSAYVPARAQLGDAKPEVTVLLAISGDGRLLEARIERPSGNAAMDSAVTRLLNDLRTQILPKSPDGRPWRNRVTFDTRG